MQAHKIIPYRFIFKALNQQEKMNLKRTEKPERESLTRYQPLIKAVLSRY
jgi:hypothetical protein